MEGESSGSCPSSGCSRRPNGGIAGKKICTRRPSRGIAGVASPRTRSIPGRLPGGASSRRPSRGIAGVTSPRTRSLPGRLPDVEVSLLDVVMAPLWPESLMERFVKGCCEVVSEGFTVPANTDMFYAELEKYMNSNSNDPVTKKELAEQFNYLKDLWGEYQLDKKSVTLYEGLKGAGTKNLEQQVKLTKLKKSIDVTKYKVVLGHKEQLDYIFSTCMQERSKIYSAYLFNNKSGSSGKRSISTDEAFSRQLRQKSSEVHMPGSSQHHRTHLDAMEYLINHGIKGGSLDFSMANEFLKDNDNRSSFFSLPTFEERLEFVRVTWMLKHDPLCTSKIFRG